jgi:hypothetical protein
MPDGSPAHDVALSPLGNGRDAFSDAEAAGLVTYVPGWSPGRVRAALKTRTASVLGGEADLAYWQMPGDYRVDVSGETTQPVSALYTYLPVACCEFDFSAVPYGGVRLNTTTRIGGDTNFGTADLPTVRNIGNVPCTLLVEQDDMGLGQRVDGTWNIVYGAALGDGGEVKYGPSQQVPLAGTLPVQATRPVSFSLQVIEGSGGYSGHMVLSWAPTT